MANPAAVNVSGLDIITASFNDIIKLYKADGTALTFTPYVENSGQDIEIAPNTSGQATNWGLPNCVTTYTGTYLNGTFTTGIQASSADMLVVYDSDGTGSGLTYQGIVLVGVNNVTVSTDGIITAKYSGSTSDLVATLGNTNYNVQVNDTASATDANTILGRTSGIVSATVMADSAAALNAALSNATPTDALTLVLNTATADISDLTGLNSKTSVSVDASIITSVTDATGVNTINLTTPGITWGSTISVTGGTGADTITLRANDAAKETIVFNPVATNGVDLITNFTAGSGKDILKVTNLAALTDTDNDSNVVYSSIYPSRNVNVQHAKAWIIDNFTANSTWSDVTTIINNAIDVSGTTSVNTAILVSNGTDTNVYLYQNDTTSNSVQNAELTLVGTITNVLASNLIPYQNVVVV